MDYAILDIETTGGKYNEEGIIEIAVYRFNGEKITDTFISLVNPEKEIHHFVQKLTGITSKMVRTAPKFYELAKRLIEITEDAVIVAHNVDFDYRVICSEFSRLGYEFKRPVLDTISLSRTLLPDMSSYSLGNLCGSLGIPISDRHRAHGDARATVKLFQILKEKDSKKNIIQTFINNIDCPCLNKKVLLLMEGLPSDAGVFYLHDTEGKIVYLDKGMNIRSSVRQILIGNSKKTKILQQKTDNISYELTGEYVVALLKYQKEVKEILPEIKTKKSKPISTIYGLFYQKKDQQLFIELISQKNKRQAILTFISLERAESFIDRGVFSNSVTSEENLADKFMKEAKCDEEYLLLVGKGRVVGEKSFIFMEQGIVIGYGFYTLHSQVKTPEHIYRIMTMASGDRNVLQEIRNRIFVTKSLKKTVLQKESVPKQSELQFHLE